MKFSLPPVEAARLEILGLSSDREFHENFMIGGTTPPEILEENARKCKKRRERVLSIIKKHGVAEAFLVPLLAEEQRLTAELLHVQKEIAELRNIQQA
jgi:hypothetical protein